MNIAIFGATGRLGTSIARQAQGTGHRLTLHVRSEEKAAALEPFGNVVVGPIDDAKVRHDVIKGADAVVSALGTTIRKKNTVLSDLTSALVKTMEECGTHRFVCVTSLGCEDSYAQVSGRLMRWIIRSPAKEIWADKERQEEHIINSSLDYLIVRPGGLSKKPAKGDWIDALAHDPLPKRQMIPIDDVAAYCISQIATPNRSNQSVSLVSA